MQKDVFKVLWKQLFETSPFEVQLKADDIKLSVAVTCYVFQYIFWTVEN